MTRLFRWTRYFPLGFLSLVSCSGTLSYDSEMDRLIENTGPGRLDEARKAYAYCAEELKRDRVVPQSMFLGACSGLKIMIIQNVVEIGDPWKIKEQFSQYRYIYPDFERWIPFYIKVANPYVEQFCSRRVDRLECLSVLR